MADPNNLPQTGTLKRRERRANTTELQGWKILLVDDQDDNLRVAEASLRYCGAETLTAENGIQGLQLVAQHTDLKVILLDLSMPDMNGCTMLEKLHENPATAAIPRSRSRLTRWKAIRKKS